MLPPQRSLAYILVDLFFVKLPIDFLCLFCAFSTQNMNPKMVKCFPISL